MIVTNTHSEIAARPAGLDPSPSNASSAAAASADIAGQRKVLARLPSDARRQAISGPTPVSSNSGSPKATRKKL